MIPNQVSRGEANVNGQILGTNLNGATSVNLGDGLTVQSVVAVSSTQVDVQFSVAVGASAGARTISVTTSGGTATSSTSLTVSNNRAPVPRFSISPTSGAKNTTFVFDASDSTDAAAPATVRTYGWEFGDGQSARGRTVEHRYNAAGTFEVVLTVTDNSEAANSASAEIEVADGIAPVARYTVTPPSGDLGTPFTFNGSTSSDSDGTIDLFEWNFADGTKAQGEVVNHEFKQGGVFTVVLTVMDNDGLESAAQKDIRVEDFNEQEAIQDITDLIERFFRRFADLEHLPTEVIVEGWSESPACRGRDREIRIIDTQKLLVRKTDNELTKPVAVFIKPSHVDANANATARFQYTLNNGTKATGDALHEFTLIFEDGEWQICNFAVTPLDAPMNRLFPQD